MTRLLSILFLLTLCARATVYTWNGDAQWGSSSPVAGDTVNLTNTFTTNHTISWSGTSNNPITFYMEPGCKFSSPTLPNGTIWLNVNNQHDIVIDGGSNGIMTLTDNGTLNSNAAVAQGQTYYGGTNDYNNAGIYAIASELGSGSVSNILVKNLIVSNIYNRQTNTEPNALYGGNDCGVFVFQGVGFTMSNCTITGCPNMFTIANNGEGSNATLECCLLSNYNHCIYIGNSTGFNNLVIWSNKFYTGDMYETANSVINSNGDLGLHRNTIMISGTNGLYPPYGFITNVYIYQNYVQTGTPTSLSWDGGTAINYWYGQYGWHVREYNNVFYVVNGMYVGGPGVSGNDCLFANNTLITTASNGNWLTIPLLLDGPSGATNYSYNNIAITGSGINMSVEGTLTNGGQTYGNCMVITNAMNYFYSDYNIYNNCSTYIFEMNNGLGGGGYGTAFDGWNEYTNLPEWTDVNGEHFLGWFSPHLDPHGITNTMVFGSGFIPATNSVAITNGVNLTAWGITNDFSGNPRPGGTTLWTIGAYQVGTNAPPPPTTNYVNIFLK